MDASAAHESRRRLTEGELNRFHASLHRCTTDAKFLDRFYARFLESSPTVREMFANTNWLRQHRMMVASFHLMTLAEEEGADADADAHLRRVARLHGKNGHDIPADLYDNWLESLMETVEETDPKFDGDIDRLWRQVMKRGIARMQHASGEGASG